MTVEGMIAMAAAACYGCLMRAAQCNRGERVVTLIPRTSIRGAQRTWLVLLRIS